MTFKEQYLEGTIPFEAIDDFIEEWNTSDDNRRLSVFLGLTSEEEDIWIDDSDEALQDLLDSYERVKGTPVTLGRTGIIVNKKFEFYIWRRAAFLFKLLKILFAYRGF